MSEFMINANDGENLDRSSSPEAEGRRHSSRTKRKKRRQTRKKERKRQHKRKEEKHVRRRTGTYHSVDLSSHSYSSDDSDSDSDFDDPKLWSVESKLEQRHIILNHMFGIKPWKPSITTKPLEEHSEVVQELYQPIESQQRRKRHSVPCSATLGNMFYTVIFGWQLYLVYAFFAVVMYLTCIGRPYARVCWTLKDYFLWPFGKIVVRDHDEEGYSTVGPLSDNEELFLIPPRTDGYFIKLKKKLDCRNYTLRGVVWFFFGAVPLTIFHFWVFFWCWLCVVYIPMAEINRKAIVLLYSSPHTVKVAHNTSSVTSGSLLICYEAANYNYYKYSVDGINVCLLNFLPLVFLSLVLGYIVPHIFGDPPSILLFVCCLFSVVPIAYYIGTAVSSLSAQSNFAVGAVLNATFGSVVELILYGSAIKQGGLDELIQSSVTGSFLGALILLPGLAMIAGGYKKKQQKVSVAVTGVSSALLFIAIVGAFTPTIFYNFYGVYDIRCQNCMYNSTAAEDHYVCGGCEYDQTHFDDDPIFKKNVKPLMYAAAAILPIGYLIGLLFTFKTHKHIYEQFEKQQHEEGAEGHDAPTWSKLKGLAILILATILFALIAEELIDSIKPTLDSVGLSQSFVGITVFALVPSAAEFVNAVMFAVSNNVALSIEIGNSVAIQIAMIQMPVLVIFSTVITHIDKSAGQFILLFPMIDVFAVIMGVIIINYIHTEGTTNYFKGFALCLIYCMFIVTFYFVPEKEINPAVNNSFPTNRPIFIR
eukprot:CAMPEP_0174254412 /NCGR_PEP_ID=MMETSP0439-20130205/3737_1 /TAXON_ID=0 /ORGANISM="Stereomyxa ramosa, Strain Chinc5" /LENGTH=759 /DNA_ID=CAMNT_0015335975 /DNA_START=135 /DNA_END=2414 /DNA_ORIENTATION=-